jgi:hypothetical protein
MSSAPHPVAAPSQSGSRDVQLMKKRAQVRSSLIRQLLPIEFAIIMVAKPC